MNIDEMNDLAADPGYADRLESMYSALVNLQVEMGDTLKLI